MNHGNTALNYMSYYYCCIFAYNVCFQTRNCQWYYWGNMTSGSYAGWVLAPGIPNPHYYGPSNPNSNMTALANGYYVAGMYRNSSWELEAIQYALICQLY